MLHKKGSTRGSLLCPGDLMDAAHAGQQRSLPYSLQELLPPHTSTTLVPEGHRACESELSILLLPPESFSQTVSLNQMWQRQELNMKLVQIWGELG